MDQRAALEEMAAVMAHAGDILLGEWHPRTRKLRAMAQDVMDKVNAGRAVLRQLGLVEKFDAEFFACQKDR